MHPQVDADRRAPLPLGKSVQDVPVGDTRRVSKVWENTSSDTLPSFRTPPHDTEDVDFLNPERLLPEKHSPWGFLKLPGGFNGSTVPMLAMQALTRSGTNMAESARNKVDQTLLRVLGHEQVNYLVDMFEDRYSPWLNLQPRNLNQVPGPLLRLAECCVASRHLEPSVRSIVSPQLYRIADEFVFKQAFNPLPSTDAIHAILILSVWEPVGDPELKESRDGRLIASTAVSMAMNLRLSEAMVYARTLRNQKKPNEPLSAELVEALDKARLWFALNNVESMLCVGTGREPISDCASLIYDALDTTSHATIGASRDMRLTLVSQLFVTTQKGLSIRLRSLSEIDVFYKEVLDFLMQMDVFERLIYPLPILAEYEVFYFHMLQVYYQSCRLVVLVHALMETKAAITKTGSQNPWFLVAEHSGVNLARTWGQQALRLSEGILITALSRPESALLTSAPDNFFSMITLATIFVILSKWSVFENCGEQLPGSSDPILTRVIERLLLIACSPDHIAAKCARVIGAGLRSFRRKLEKSEDPKEFSSTMLQHFSSAAREPDVSGEGAGSRSSGQGAVGYTGETAGAGGLAGQEGLGGGTYPQQTFPNLAMTDPNYFMNSDIFLDSEFWSSFMANLADGSGMGTMMR
ncbi:hypothetical protein PAXRUDRAFT_134672 [Paxillus rubicundulus Ve08.2h10]|uniref:Transcription factor domain-containing protein n=1 Tax=Paxillus rubicundulus Ve08.2h10 TaxID=930991 RepID=A0A0D0E852_9AGAM|nr:hypothetical protein PAXRUDRAFT_134672 [Paxillus rubicundulus Ve08.2h10]